MDRLACVELPAFGLQLLFLDHPEWREHPAAVVDRESPQGEILAVNGHARRKGILSGHRYGPALALAPSLRAGTVSAERLSAGVEEVCQNLVRFTPRVEPLRERPGSFYLGAEGLWQLHRSPEHWAEAIRAHLCEMGLVPFIVVGFTRFGTLALARSQRAAAWVLVSPDEESQFTRAVRLSRLELRPKQRDLLVKLGVHTVGDLLALPPAGLLERFGPDIHQLHQRAAGENWQHLQAHLPPEPIAAHVNLDEPEQNAMRLSFLAKRLLGPLLTELAARHLALAELILTMKLDRAAEGIPQEIRDSVRVAAPTLDAVQIIDLVRLKLEGLQLSSGIVEFGLEALGQRADVEQLLFFADGNRRDLAAADRALARLRATFGDDSVVRARPREGHLPEGSFTFESCAKIQRPRVRPLPHRSLVRRILAKPQALHRRPVVGPRGAHLLGMDHEPFTHLTGPFVVSGGWWAGEVHREYYYAHGQSGRVLWIYFDQRRRKWFVHGMVE